MNKKNSFSSRRDFIKKKILGGVIYASGIPFIPLTNLIDLEKSKPAYKKLVLEKEQIDWEEIRKQFLLLDDRCYMNTASLGPSPKSVVEEICEITADLESRCDDRPPLVAAVHDKIASFFNVSTAEIAIIRNTTEGMNIVARSLELKAGDEILLTKHEHIGGAAPWIALQKEKGVIVKAIELDWTGKNNLQIIKDNLTEKTKVVSFSHVTCTTGLILPAKEIAELCRSKGIYSCIDGAQSAGMIPVDLRDINPDFYVCSGHKWLFGPKGTGILYINKQVIEKCTPVFVGSNSDSYYDLDTLALEYKKTAQREEYGTRNVPNIAGLGSAIDFISAIGIENISLRNRKLVDYFREKLRSFTNVEILTPENPKYSASIVTIRIKDKDNLRIPQKLFDTGKVENGMYIRVRGLYENEINGIRISIALCNNKSQVDYFLASLEKVLSM